jgi:hypothetical protein
MTDGAIIDPVALSERRIQALADDDLAGFAALLDERVVYVHSTGLVHRKPELLQFFSNVMRVLGVEREIDQCWTEGGIACVGAFQTLHGQLRHDPAKEIRARAYFSETWCLTGDGWRLLHAQSTALPAAQ